MHITANDNNQQQTEDNEEECRKKCLVQDFYINLTWSNLVKKFLDFHFLRAMKHYIVE
jgi:hypothetical protein